MKVKMCCDWEGKGVEALTDFCGKQYSYASEEEKKEFLKQFEGCEWIFGSYSYENYSGDAFVIFKKDGEVYENGGSHCSCYGVEGQWNPEKTSIEAIKHRLENGSLGICSSYSSENEFKKELEEFLNDIEN